MENALHELSRWRSISSLTLLVLLLAWESVVPFFAYFAGNSGERLRDDPQTLQFGLQEFDGPENHTLTGLLATPLKQVDRTSGEMPAHAISNR